MLHFLLTQLITFTRIFGLNVFITDKEEVVLEFRTLQFLAGVSMLAALSYGFFQFFTWIHN